jgi:hypothetical protein
MGLRNCHQKALHPDANAQVRRFNSKVEREKEKDNLPQRNRFPLSERVRQALRGSFRKGRGNA